MKRTLFTLAKSPLGELIIGIAFGKFSKLLPINRITETDKAIAFYHPKPHWEEHILIVPKKAIKNLSEVKDSDFEYVTECLKIAKQIINEEKWSESDYTIVNNGGSRQEVAQIHFHLGSGNTLNT